MFRSQAKIHNVTVQEPSMLETLSKNITRQGLTATTLNYLRVSRAELSGGRLDELPLEAAAERAFLAGGSGPAPAAGGGGGGGGGTAPDGLDSLDFNDPYNF
jgi:hypothetical protein